MLAIAARFAPSGEAWESIPLELILSIFAIILAGALEFTGLMP